MLHLELPAAFFLRVSFFFELEVQMQKEIVNAIRFVANFLLSLLAENASIQLCSESGLFVRACPCGNRIEFCV